jgi:GAF domain-containing protein
MRTIQRMLMQPPIHWLAVYTRKNVAAAARDTARPASIRTRDTSESLPETSNPRLLDLLAETARELVDRLKADASGVSRVIGDVLILVTECAPEGRTLQLGQGYLVPDYPATQDVLVTGTPRALTIADEGVDEEEARVLGELGFASLLMMRLQIGGVTWALVEVYRGDPVAFDDEDVRVAAEILARTSARAGS